MKYVWNMIERLNRSAESKYHLAVLVFGIAAALLGLFASAVALLCGVSGWDRMVCLIGYPVIISLPAATLYTCYHSFHDGSHTA